MNFRGENCFLKYLVFLPPSPTNVLSSFSKPRAVPLPPDPYTIVFTRRVSRSRRPFMFLRVHPKVPSRNSSLLPPFCLIGFFGPKRIAFSLASLGSFFQEVLFCVSLSDHRFFFRPFCLPFTRFAVVTVCDARYFSPFPPKPPFSATLLLTNSIDAVYFIEPSPESAGVFHFVRCPVCGLPRMCLSFQSLLGLNPPGQWCAPLPPPRLHALFPQIGPPVPDPCNRP